VVDFGFESSENGTAAIDGLSLIVTRTRKQKNSDAQHIEPQLEVRSAGTADVCGHLIPCSCQKLRHANLGREVADASSLTGCHRIVHLARLRRPSSERVTRHSDEARIGVTRPPSRFWAIPPRECLIVWRGTRPGE
jgi:hypothetical protein